MLFLLMYAADGKVFLHFLDSSHTQTHTHTHTHTHTQTHTHASTYAHTHKQMHIHAYAHINKLLHTGGFVVEVGVRARGWGSSAQTKRWC